MLPVGLVFCSQVDAYSVDSAAALATGCEVKITIETGTYDIRQNKALGNRNLRNKLIWLVNLSYQGMRLQISYSTNMAPSIMNGASAVLPQTS